MTSLSKGKIVVPGWSDDDVVKALVNDDGRIPVNVENLPTELETKIHGWNGSSWHKLPLVWGFSGIVEQALSHSDLGDEHEYLYGSQVQAGEIWVITLTTIYYAGTVPDLISLTAGGLATGMSMFSQDDPVSGKWYFCDRQIILQVDDQIYGYVLNSTAGDTFLVRYAGYSMKIAE